MLKKKLYVKIVTFYCAENLKYGNDLNLSHKPINPLQLK